MGEGVLSAPRSYSPDAVAGFTRRDGWLHADAIPLAAIAQAAGTPAYVYSASVVRARWCAPSACSNLECVAPG